ncbi:MAG: zinc-dependent metalloprotease [Planctomycetes bacterium]|nr:zinc-dependent metalloprotease [Planctomycetota bacterium]
MYFRTVLTCLISVILGGCVTIYPPQQTPPPAPPQPGPAKPEEKKDPFKPWADVLKDTEPKDGFFKMHFKRDRSLLLEIKPDQLDKDFGLILHVSRGIGESIQNGLPLSDTRLMRCRRIGDQVQLLQMNPRFIADAGSPMKLSLDSNVGNSIVAIFKIESENKENKNLLIDFTGFVVSDYSDFGRWIKSYYGEKPAGFDKERSFIGKIMGFPKNIEIDAELTYRAGEAPPSGGDTISDYRSVPVGVRYSIFALPEKPIMPRLADQRVGHFITAVKDMSKDRELDPYLRYVERWRLEKKDPTAEISEPVQPIVYYVDRSVPAEYRQYVKEGIEAWNKAFEKAGFKNAIIAKDPPADDPNWSAEDIRYSTVRWTAAHNMGYAVGPSQSDPRSGELLNADVLIDSEFVRWWKKSYDIYAKPEKMLNSFEEIQKLQRSMPAHLAQRMCFAQAGKSFELSLQQTLLICFGLIDLQKGMPEEFLGDALRDLVMHEIGHTLGLRHNFKSSSGISNDKLHNKDYTREHGVTLSVMDYAPVNFSLDQKKQGHYYSVEVGTYDVWAIQYAYMPVYQRGSEAEVKHSVKPVSTPEAELPVLKKIAEQSSNPLHTYGTDEDNWLGPYAVDPLSNAWDLGTDPVKFVTERIELMNQALSKAESRLIESGDSYDLLREVVANLIISRVRYLTPAVKTVGGSYVSRDHKDTKNASLPFTMVPADKQREAIKLITESVLTENAFKIDTDILNKLMPSRWAHWGTSWLTFPLDFPIHSFAVAVQRNILDDLLSSPRIHRMIDNEARASKGDEIYSASELFKSLTSSIWSEVTGKAKNVNSFRRNLQRVHLDILSRYVLAPSGSIPEDARSLARFHLTKILDSVDNALANADLNDATKAHLTESRAKIAKVLEAIITQTIK